MAKFYTTKITTKDICIRNESDLWRAITSYEDGYYEATGDYPKNMFAKPPAIGPLFDYYSNQSRDSGNFFNIRDMHEFWIQTDRENGKKDHAEKLETALAYWGCASLAELVDLGHVLSCSKNIEEGRFFLFKHHPFSKECK